MPFPLDESCCIKDKSVGNYMGDIIDVGEGAKEDIDEENVEGGDWEI